MLSKFIGMAAVCTIFSTQTYAQDLVCAAIGVNGTENKKSLIIKIHNQHSRRATPYRAYVELHSDNPSNNPIAQISLTKSGINGWKTKVYKLRLKDFKIFRPGFGLTDAKKVVVICDPKNEVKETKEDNNITSKRLL